MSGPKCAFNTAAALRRVFIPSNLGTSEHLHVTRIFVPALLASSLHQARMASWSTPAPSRSGSFFGQTMNRGKSPVVRQVGKPRPEQAPRRVAVKLGRLPRDDEIREQYVHMVEGTDEYGRPILSDARRTKDILAKLDSTTYSLQVVKVQMPEGEEVDWPVCKVINKREELQKQKREKEKKKTATVLKEKTLELNWALAPHDQEHKLRQMQKFLAKGFRVQVCLMKKQNGKARATVKDAQALVDRIVESALEVKGTQEWKKREGALLQTLKINFQGKAQEKVEDEGREGAKEKAEGNVEA